MPPTISHSAVMPLKRRLLFVDDDKTICGLFQKAMEKEPIEIETVSNGRQAVERLKTFRADIVITDMQMPVMDGMALIQKIRWRWPDIFIIAITGHGSVKDAVAAIKAGAYDYILKPFDFTAIRMLVKKIADHKKILNENTVSDDERRRDVRFENIIGRHPSMYELFRKIEAMDHSDATVLVTGETGAGKELIAKAIHYRSRRKAGPFMGLNCGAISQSLVASELFGHEKGAFTGAVSLKKGYFEMADKGTVFLDEIGDVPIPVQILLLRVLELGTFQRVGGTRPVTVDVRIVCATHKDLGHAVKQGLFREDLFYRINVVALHVPPLRERKSDIPLLADHFIKRYCRKAQKEILRISGQAMTLLLRHDWPGNVREFASIMENAVIFSKGGKIVPADIADLLQRNRPREKFSLDLCSRSLFDAESTLIKTVLDETNWNLTQAAEALKIARGTLYSKMKKYGIEKP